MKRHPKAARTESTEDSGIRRLRDALAPAAFGDANGSGALADSPAGGVSSRGGVALALVSLAALLALVFVPTAGAAQTQRPFKEVFGSAAQPSNVWSSAVAVDRQSGDVLVADDIENTITRFHADGTPAPFSALGTNAIDGKEVNGKPCAEEPASCDKTPEDGIEVEGPTFTQIAIDESGGPTDGDIYVTQPFSELVDIFAADGSYLGQLTAAGQVDFGSLVRGVTVDAAGAVYVTSNGKIHEYVPSANPAVNADNVASFELPPGWSPSNVAVGSGPTVGSIFAVVSFNGVPGAAEFDKETGELKYTFPEGYGNSAIAVDPNTGTVLIGGSDFNVRSEVGEFEAPGGSAPVRVSRLLADNEGGGFRVSGFAVNGSSEVLLSEGPSNPNLRVYGTPGIVPAVTVEPASDVSGTKATLSGTVNPTGLAVTECFFEYGETAEYGSTEPCEGSIPTDSNPHPVHANLSGLEPNGNTYHFRLVATNANGKEESADQTLVTADTVVTEAATPIGTTMATLNGTVRPEGDAYSECFFEYGLSSSASFEEKAPCSPGASGIAPDFSPHAVKAAITGLQVGATYRYRLVATNSAGTLKGEELTFNTYGAPRIGEVRARDADQGSVTIEAKINPSGFGTSYHFEWGPTTAYGNDVPADFEPFVGSGTEPVLVKAKISGLSTGSVYHYRVVATNSVATTRSPDQELETLNSCGLPDGRCFELVSPRDAGPIALPGETTAFHMEMLFQAATNPGAIAYAVESGLPGATRGAEVLYGSKRESSGWSAAQLSPPILVRDERQGETSRSGRTLGLSPDLSCGVTESNQPLTADASTRAVMEAGGTNLYRSNPDGSYVAISKLRPENFEFALEENFALAGFSQNCGKVVFTSQYRFPGIAGAGTERLYEWDEGALRNLGIVPGPSGETVVAAIPGSPGNSMNVVSEDGSRVFFSAERQTSGNPEEIGKTAVFVREDGGVTRDLSLSETATPNYGAVYQFATPDGSRVFFTANAGLTAESSPEGTDLYEYDLETEELTDLSVEDEAGGAEVVGMVGASEDGSHVYFAARGQLVPGKGRTFAKNQEDSTYSLYGKTGGVVSFVGTVDGAQTVQSQEAWASRVSPDGRYLLFEASNNVTGYDSDGAPEAYLYDADASSEATICVSCRQDGQPPVFETSPPYRPLLTPRAANDRTPITPPRTLVIKGGKPQVIFSSLEGLAPGARAGETSLYVWSHGQVFRLATELPGLRGGNTERYVSFFGASADGSDLYLQTSQSLTWEDGDQRSSIYDARIGGGFPRPAAPPAPCSPTTEGSCSGASSPPPAVPGAGSATFTGPGNVKSKQQKRKHKKRKHRKQRQQQKKKAQHANGNRRAGK